MSGHKDKPPNVPLSEDKVIEHLRNSLITLEVLCNAFDQGAYGTAFSMATEVSKVLTSNAVAVRLRGQRQFRTFLIDRNERNLAPEMKLVAARIHGNGTIEFIRAAAYTNENSAALSFREWWNRDVIYRASAAPPGFAPGSFPLLQQDQIPYDKRATLVRSRLVELMRNKLGAHIDTNSPELLDELQRADSFAPIEVQTPHGVFSTRDGTLKQIVGPRAAMMRIVSDEVLAAYQDILQQRHAPVRSA